jgi:hypothetical protein
MAHGGVGTLRAGRVKERHQYALLHQLVDLGHSLVERRGVRRNIRLGETKEVVADFSWEIDLGWLARRTLAITKTGDIPLAVLIHGCRHRSSDATT